ncbi:MAG: PKD domain-containing protein, partial [Thermoplasmatota archaeon]
MGTARTVVYKNGTNIGNYTMQETNIDETGNGLYTYNFIPSSLGTYAYHIWANDINGNSVQSSSADFAIEDTTQTRIANITVHPALQDIGEPVNISCILEDNHQVSDAWLHVEQPGGGTINTSMQRKDYMFFLNSTYHESGTYTFNIIARDESGNVNTSTSHTFIITSFPRASFTYEPSAPTDWDVVMFTSTSSDVDGSIVNHSWLITKNNTGSVILISSQSNISHNFTDNGDYVVSLTVVDDKGATNTTTQMVTILNIFPVANFSFTPSIPTVG